jgi:hypothetical protein
MELEKTFAPKRLTQVGIIVLAAETAALKLPLACAIGEAILLSVGASWLYRDRKTTHQNQRQSMDKGSEF